MLGKRQWRSCPERGIHAKSNHYRMSGRGKSTFARALYEASGLPLFHLDMMYWNPDRTKVPREVFQERLEEALGQERWIIDGNYNRTMEMRMQACDTIFFLDYPVEVCLEGANARKGTKRTDLPWVEGEDDQEDEEFLEFIRTFRQESRPRIIELWENMRTRKYIYLEAGKRRIDFWRDFI